MFSRGRLDFRPGFSGGALEIRKRFERKVVPHLDLLYASAFQLTQDKRRAGDLCEQAVLRAYSLFPGLGAADNCRVWLLTILFEIFRARSSSGRQVAAIQQPLPESFDRMHRGRRNYRVDFPANAEAGCGEIQALFQNLPQDCRVTLFLIEVEELSYADAARVMEVPIETIRSRVSQGRALMRCALGRVS